MAHVIVEHSANLSDVVDVQDLLRRIHRAVLDTGVAELDALRTRGESRSMYVLADDDPDNMFVAVTARFGAGRSPEDKQRVIEAVLEALVGTLGDGQRTALLSVEYQDIDPALRVNRNNLRAVIASRGTPPTTP